MTCITLHREGRLVDRDLVKGSVEGIVTLGVTAADRLGLGRGGGAGGGAKGSDIGRSLYCYEEDLEAVFLAGTRAHYTAVCQRLAAEQQQQTGGQTGGGGGGGGEGSLNSIAFLRQVDEIFVAEHRLVARFLHGVTDGKVQQLLEQVLLEENLLAIIEQEQSGLKYLFNQYQRLLEQREEVMGGAINGLGGGPGGGPGSNNGSIVASGAAGHGGKAFTVVDDLSLFYRFVVRLGSPHHSRVVPVINNHHHQITAAAPAGGLRKVPLEEMARVLREVIIEAGRRRLASLTELYYNNNNNNPSTATGSGNSKAPPLDVDGLARETVSSLLSLHSHYAALLSVAFAGHAKLQEALSLAFVYLANLQQEVEVEAAAKEGEGKGGAKAVKKVKMLCELLAIYQDKLLKGGGAGGGVASIGQQEVGTAVAATTTSHHEQSLLQSLELFTYLQDKDLYRDHYKRLLSHRLLASWNTGGGGGNKEEGGNSSQGDYDSEKSLLSSLKLRCGQAYTSPMEGMLHEMIHSEGGSSNRLQVAVQGCEASLLVLTLGHWPAAASSPAHLPLDLTSSLTLPPALGEAKERLRQSYVTGSSSSRRLAWQYHLGQVTVRAHYSKAAIGAGAKTANPSYYDLSMTLLQAAVLWVIYDPQGGQGGGGQGGGGWISFPAILQGLGWATIAGQEGKELAEEIVRRVLDSLSYVQRFALVKRERPYPTPGTAGAGGGASNSNGRAAREDDRFTILSSFTSKLRRVKLPSPNYDSLAGGQGQGNNKERSIEENRKPVLEAAIVRIMKSRKALLHRDLLMEVMRNVSFFKPSPDFIKKVIEGLIEREYLKRDDENHTLYHYIS